MSLIQVRKSRQQVEIDVMPKADDYQPLVLIQPTTKSDNGKLQAALLPFARAASDYEPPKSKLYRDEEHVALRITAGDLRTARHVLLEDKQPATTANCWTWAELNVAAMDFIDGNDASRDMNNPDAIKFRLFLGMYLQQLKQREQEVG